MTRLRALIERPHDPEVARAIVLLALLVSAGLGCLIVVSAHDGGGRPDGGHGDRAPATRGSLSPGTVWPTHRHTHAKHPPVVRRQDPQDRPGTAAHRRAEREQATHRALQRLPFRRGDLSIELVGAKGSRAILEVNAPSLAAARRGWRSFLRSARDDGRSYVPRFLAKGGSHGR